MDLFTVSIIILGLFIFLGAVLTVIGYCRYWDQKQKLPEACSYIGLKEKNESLSSENDRLTDANKSLGKIVDEAERKKAWLDENQPLLLSLEEDRKKQEELKTEYEVYLDKLSNLIPQVQTKTDDFNTLTNKVVTAEKELTLYQTNIKEIIAKLDTMRQEKAELEARNASLLKENETQNIENEAAEKKLFDLQETIKNTAANLSETTRMCNEVSNKYDSLCRETEVKTKELADLEEQLESLIQEIKAKEFEKNELEKILPELAEEYKEQQKQNDSLLQSFSSLQSKYGELDKVVKDLNTVYQETQIKAKTLKAENEVAEKNKLDLEEKFSKLNEKLDTMRQEKAELEARNASLLKENETQNIENEAAVRKLRELQDMVGAESDKLTNINAEYTEKKLELDSYQMKKDALLKEIDILKESVEALRKESGMKGGTNEDTLKDLWEPIIFPNLLPGKKEASEQDQLAQTKDYIRGKKLYFPDRVIHAFHTSVKCNDISPITVLAGISGTGKSELPKCYAEGMGMHFSMLAVQPRWDSPQDLLGFYNYMENKYKATELARALVRFDRYNRSSWGSIPPECDDRSDRMLLVLLDEMNLARVEYYFSEFLSKLETRRGVNCEDAANRVKAEIELELIGRAPLRLFADRNILFTGTMNEDESTQTLSDKVLDRANVLRFGKPLSANIAAKLKNSKEIPPRKDGLTHARWRSWCTDAKNVKMDDTVYNWINELNSAMEELQKPFGHRVAQAIAAYIANYPKSVSNGDEKKLAFADQIEQRIMPKLRGVDLELYEDGLAKIGNLILETGDEKLHNAYTKGLRNNTNGIFMWQGIDRSEEI